MVFSLLEAATNNWVDVSWISTIAEGITDVFSVMTQPPINMFIGVALIGTVVGLIKRFM